MSDPSEIARQAQRQAGILRAQADNQETLDFIEAVADWTRTQDWEPEEIRYINSIRRHVLRSARLPVRDYSLR
jgi:hypothetical protein